MHNLDAEAGNTCDCAGKRHIRPRGRRDLNEVGAVAQPGAILPLNLPLWEDDGISKPARFWLGTKPSVWVLADYTCKSLCGPVISIVSAALAQSGLRPGAVVLGGTGCSAGVLALGISLVWFALR